MINNITIEQYFDAIEKGNFTDLAIYIFEMGRQAANEINLDDELQHELKQSMNICILNYIKANYPDYFAKKIEEEILKESD